MEKQAGNHVNHKLSESDRAPAKPTDAVSEEFVTEMFEYDGGRHVTVYVQPDPPEAIVFAGDGQRISKWGRLLEKADVASTMIVGVHGLTDEMLRLHEYSPGFAPERFARHEKFFVEEVRRWTESTDMTLQFLDQQNQIVNLQEAPEPARYPSPRIAHIRILFCPAHERLHDCSVLT